MLTNVTPNPVNDLSTSFGTYNGAVWHLVAEKLDVFWLDPFTINLLFLVHHVIVYDSCQVTFSVQAELVATGTIAMEKDAPVFEPLSSHWLPIPLGDGAGPG